MPDRQIIADTGPLVALLLEDDAHHVWAVERVRELPAPFLTCEPVLAETFHLVSRLHNGTRRFFEMLESGLLVVGFDLLADWKPVAKLALKYVNLPMSLADACLVRMSELQKEALVFTLDNHFRIYRKNGRQIIPTIMPPG